MANLRVVLAIFLFVTISGITNGAPPERKCRGVFTDLNKRELQQINVCTKSLGYKSGREKSQKSTCTMKCVLTNEGMIEQNGKLSYDQFDKYLEEHFPVSLQARANETFRPCLDLFQDKVIDVDDEFCKPYEPLVKCLSRNFSNLCRGLP